MSRYMKIAESDAGDAAVGMGEQEWRNVDPRTHRHKHGDVANSGLVRHLPHPAPPIGSVASIWAARQVVSIVWYSMVYSVVWYGTVWYIVWYGMVQYGISCGMVWYSMVYSVVWYGIVWYMVWYGWSLGE